MISSTRFIILEICYLPYKIFSEKYPSALENGLRTSWNGVLRDFFSKMKLCRKYLEVYLAVSACFQALKHFNFQVIDVLK
jgi:hypothetical protein